MRDTLVGGLILAFISGLTFLAYKHPKGYRKVAYVLSTVAFGLIGSRVLLKVFLIDNDIRHLTSLLKIRPQMELGDVKEYIDQLEQSTLGITRTLGVGAVFLGYLVFLWFLPKILEMDLFADKPASKASDT
jgi:hypothetical protein